MHVYYLTMLLSLLGEDWRFGVFLCESLSVGYLGHDGHTFREILEFGQLHFFETFVEVVRDCDHWRLVVLEFVSLQKTFVTFVFELYVST